MYVCVLNLTTTGRMQHKVNFFKWSKARVKNLVFPATYP